MILMETFKNRMKLNAKDATIEAGSVVGFTTGITSSHVRVSLQSSSRESMKGIVFTMTKQSIAMPLNGFVNMPLLRGNLI